VGFVPQVYGLCVVLADQLADMRRFASHRFYYLDPEKREEAVQNTLALAWKSFHKLSRQGRANAGILKSVVHYAVRKTQCKQVAQDKARAKDALDYRDRSRVKFEWTDLNGLVGRNTPILDQVSFRMDIPAFLGTLKPRHRLLACELAAGMTTVEAAERHGLTPSGISQFRRRFRRRFDEFFGN
jgi:DNA-directed RNA polymerase specialized sigma24 family protein